MTINALPLAIGLSLLATSQPDLPIFAALRSHLALQDHEVVAVPPPYLCDDQPACTINRLLAAHIYEQNQEWLKAADLYQDLVEELPVIADYLLLRQANCDLSGDALNRAKTAADRLNEQYPDSRFTKNQPQLLPDILLALGDYSQAETQYTDLIEKGTRTSLPQLRLGLAQSLLAQNKSPAAAEQFQYISTHCPATEEAKKAQTALDKLASDNVYPPELSFNEQKAYAKALRKSGLNTKAASLYEKLLKKSKKDGKNYLEISPLLLDALLAADKYPETASWMRVLPLDKFADQPQRYELETRLARGQHNKLKQEQIFARMVENLPQNKAARTAILNRACDAHDDGNFELALKHLVPLFADNKTDAIAQDAMWRTFLIHFEQKKYKQAKPLLEQLGKIYQHDNSGQARIQYWLGRTFEAQGQKDAARQAYAKIKELLPLGYYAMLAAERLGETAGHSFCGDAPRNLPLAGRITMSDATDQEAVRRAALFSAIGLSKEVFNELASLTKSGTTEENIQLALALGDYHHAHNWARKALGNSANTIPTAENQALFEAFYPLTYPEYIYQAATGNNLSDLLLQALMRQESAYKPFAYSCANARGLMQIIPKTGRKIAKAKGVEDFRDERLFEEALSIDYSAWYLAALLQKYNGQLPLAIGSYNAGPKAMSRWLDARGDLEMDLFVERIPYRETRNYIKYVLGGLYGYCAVYAPGTVIPWPEKPDKKYGDNINF